ncbi:hypothetical protein Q0Z83_032670 [Actinoplanes sichuanensis]|uniref:Pentapeptide repeat-containing protein n=1 Tax=Actinoplanes sichuanensis TaxID=512349 RepID=A0ABW4A5N3_9ACTN|nr:pentapeptide repeat-containing protein [Actinoplanes sichuanensis]BEL05076.1 hypothetical protein Q0Z83_032670 [Actinoplanes sichuanensis]
MARLIAVLAGAATLLFLLLGPIAWWATPAKHLTGKDKADARNSTRQVLLAGIGGIGLLVGASFTARTYFLARRGQVTERYGKAVAQLSSEKLVERLGGIYALEHVMADSLAHHETVCSVLAAFVREEARGKTGTGAGDHVATDVEAAVSVLGRRPHRRERGAVDLTGAWLTGADLAGAYLEGAVLRSARLDAADLSGIHLDQADLRETVAENAKLDDAHLRGVRLGKASLKAASLANCDLRDADLTSADLIDVRASHCDFRNADLHHAVLEGADLGDSDLSGAVLTGARLREADLSRTIGLVPEQLDAARVDDSTRIPAYAVIRNKIIGP